MVWTRMSLFLAAAALAGIVDAGVPTLTATSDGTLSTSEDLENSCSLGCAVGWLVDSSSSSPGHDASMLDDSKPDTAWVAHGGATAPQSIIFRFPVRVFGDLAQLRFDGFMIIPGFAASDSIYREYARPKSLPIEWNDRVLVKVDLADRRADQLIRIPDIFLKRGDVVRVRITDVYPGSKQKPVAITALVPLGAH